MSRLSLVGFCGPVAPLTRDPIKDASRRLGIAEKAVFQRAAEWMKFSNSIEVGDYRFSRWFKYGEIPEWVSKYLTEVCHAPIQH